MNLGKPPQGTNIIHEQGYEDRSYTLVGDVLTWHDQMLYEWDDVANRFQRWEDGPPPGWKYLYFWDINEEFQTGQWASLDVPGAEMHSGTFG